MKEKSLGFGEAKESARAKIVYTNHTLVTAGHDLYESDLLNINLAKYITELGVPLSEIIPLGTPQDSTAFSSTLFAIRTAGKINAVSRIHSEKAKDIWPNHAMIPVTNGVHIASWDITAEDDIWRSHIENKKVLLQKINLVAGQTWDENSLLIGWARRLVPYKRPLALFENISRLKKILEEKNIRVVISGTLHPGDEESQGIFGEFREMFEGNLKGFAVFLPDYDMALARMMVAGSDIWLNTPTVGFEACGTSGMKAALNGALPASTLDGWVPEIDLFGIGWGLDSDKINDSILNTLENEIAPLYSKRNANGVPDEWVENIKRARKIIQDRFSTTRMLREYIEQLYFPLIQIPKSF
jgi:starch phosphorylase